MSLRDIDQQASVEPNATINLRRILEEYRQEQLAQEIDR